MKVAVALFRNRTSPRAECCTAVLLAEVGDGRAEPLGVVTAPGVVLADRVAALRDARVQLLVCGGITKEAAQAVEAAGIRVISEVCGDAEEVLNLLATGALQLEPVAAAAGGGRHG
jgi:predicted Fe-Mo cluster-binding NifX family protein